MKEPMSGQSTAGTPLCPRCKATQMVEVTSIAPLLHEPGLIAYECPSCGHRPLIPHMADERALNTTSTEKASRPCRRFARSCFFEASWNLPGSGVFP